MPDSGTSAQDGPEPATVVTPDAAGLRRPAARVNPWLPGRLVARWRAALRARAPGAPRIGVPFPRIDALIPILIAVVSLSGAVVTWRASDSAARAGELDAQVIREVTEEQQITSQIDAIVGHDRRVFADYQQHIRAWRALTGQAALASETDPELASALTFEALGHLAQARALRPLFRGYRPDFGDAEGVVLYDVDVGRTFLIGHTRLGELDPQLTTQLAAERHAQAIQSVAVVILLVGALFLLTVAQLGRGITRIWFAGLGAAVAVMAGAALIVIEVAHA